MKRILVKYLSLIILFICSPMHTWANEEYYNEVIPVSGVAEDNLQMELIDLGLSVGWASCNIGAISQEDYGEYFSWGEIESKRGFYMLYYKHYDKDSKKYIFIGDDISETEYDVATCKLGGKWRMPTSDEFKELIDSCEWEWMEIDNNNGYKITGPNGNSIFLPAAGRYEAIKCIEKNVVGNYWSSINDKVNDAFAFVLDFCEDDFSWSFKYRYVGCPIRPVSLIDGDTGVRETINTTEKYVISTSYYTINGFKVKEPIVGNFYIKEDMYNDGTKKKSKIIL